MRKAASVVLVRFTQSWNLEVLMLRRSPQLKFAPNMIVFPGGAIDEHDKNLATGTSDLDVLRVTAARELFEETGVSIGKDFKIHTPSHGVMQEVANDPSRFTEVLGADGRSALNRLQFWHCFITPRSEPKRFHTTFFLYCMEPGSPAPEIIVDNSEIVAYEWATPADAVARCKEGTLRMLPPQFLILDELSTLGPHHPNDFEALSNSRLALPPVEPHFAGLVEGQLFGLGEAKCIALTLPGDHSHNDFPGPAGHLNRLVCPVPIGTKYVKQLGVAGKL